LTTYTTTPTATQWGKQWKFAERVEPRPAEKDAGPQKWKKCGECGRLFPAFRRKHVWRCCPGYSDLWAGDQRIRLFRALGEYQGDSVTMVTVTAPGADLLPWSSRCQRLGKHRHSGNLGCGVDAEIARSWNEAAPGYWRRLHEAARESVRRQDLEPPRLLVKAWEYQRRGVLHLHLIFGYGSAVEKEAVDSYVQYVHDNAWRAYFGYVDRKLQEVAPSAAAAYLSSYFVAGKGDKLDIRETVKREDVPAHVIYVAPMLMQASGISMRTLRLRRYLWWKIGADSLKIVDWLGLHLEDVYTIEQAGFWGRAFLNSWVDTKLAPV